MNSPALERKTSVGPAAGKMKVAFVVILTELVKTLQYIDGWRTVGKEGMVIKGSGKKSLSSKYCSFSQSD